MNVPPLERLKTELVLAESSLIISSVIAEQSAETELADKLHSLTEQVHLLLLEVHNDTKTTH